MRPLTRPEVMRRIEVCQRQWNRVRELKNFLAAAHYQELWFKYRGML